MTRRVWIAAAAFVLGACATDGTSTGGGAGFYSDWSYYHDAWYGGGCCINLPDEVGPPHPEHPIVMPPGSDPRPTHPIALPPGGDAKPSQPIASPSPAPRPAAMPRMSGGGGRGRR